MSRGQALGATPPPVCPAAAADHDLGQTQARGVQLWSWHLAAGGLWASSSLVALFAVQNVFSNIPGRLLQMKVKPDFSPFSASKHQMCFLPPTQTHFPAR